MQSGASDIFTGVSSLVTGKSIDWKEWGMNKLTSLPLSFLVNG